MTPEQMMEAVRASIPNLKTQAQMTAYMAAFDALRYTLDAIYAQDAPREKMARDALEKAFDVAHQSTVIGKRYEEVPEESRGPASSAFTTPPKEYEEYDLQKRLLLELDRLPDQGELVAWYEKTKADRERIVSQSLRNVLIDAIRAKRLAFGTAS